MKYREKKIKDICSFIGGSQPPKSMFVHKPTDGYIRLVQIRDRLNDNFITFVPKNSVSKFCKKDDILIGRYGPPIFQIFRGFDGAYNVAVMKADPAQGIDKDYLYYFLQQKSILKYVESMSLRTAGQTGVELDSLYEYPVLLPTLAYQHKIANCLAILDSKIENNNKICAELENMAKTLYDYWFVQFDFPDENGKPYKTSGGKMIWNEELKREIPEGWEVKNFDNAFELVMGSSPLGETINENGDGVVFYQGKVDFGNRFPAIRTYTTAPIRFAEIGDILLSVRAPVGALNKAIEKCCIGRGIVAVKSKNSSFAFYTCAKLTPIFERYNGDGTTFGCIGKDQISKIKVVMPDNCIMKQFENTVSVIDNLIEIREKENRELASLRDFLLPMLMNGQVTVN